MASLIKMASDMFWSEKFWFANGMTWKELESDDPEVYYPRVYDINLSFFIGFVFLVIRYVNERCVINPLGRYLGVKDKKPVIIADIPILEKCFKATKGKRKLQEDEMKKICKQTDMSEREVERWFHKRRMKNALSDMIRFRECSWHLIFYSIAFCYGLAVNWNKSWFSETKNCWAGWPHQHVTNDVYYFYLFELGFYWSLMFTLFYDIKRKDFVEMVIHHFATISLMYFSWVINFVRVGTLILMLHDASDHWMAAAKIAKYCNHQTLCEIFFFIFMGVWVVCRLIYFPFWILNTTSFELWYAIPDLGYAYFMFNILLAVLQVLHIIWSYFILRIVMQKFAYGKLTKDARSDTENEELDSEETDETNKANNHVINGTVNKPKRKVTYNNKTK